jgi:hypothetical protein
MMVVETTEQLKYRLGLISCRAREPFTIEATWPFQRRIELEFNSRMFAGDAGEAP